jgi:hypothetical protein
MLKDLVLDWAVHDDRFVCLKREKPSLKREIKANTTSNQEFVLESSTEDINGWELLVTKE